MAALGFGFLLLSGIMTGMIGSDSEQSSVASILNSIQALKQEVADLKESIQADNEQTLIYILDKIAALQKEFRVQLWNLSTRVEKLEDDVVQMNQTLLIEKLRRQMEDFQSIMTCTGEPPSPQNGRTVHFERKLGSVVRYNCDVDFVQAENSTVRCHLGKWEGRPPLCTSSAISLRAHFKKYDSTVTNVSCSDHAHFSRVLDTGRGGALPAAARNYSRGRVAVLDLSSVPDDDKRGVFQCGRGNQTRIIFVIDPVGWFRRPQIASVGDNATLVYDSLSDHPSYRWLHDEQHVPAWDGRGKVEITGMRREDAGIYEIYKEGDRRGVQWFFRLVVRGCPVGFFGQDCDQNCPTCYNGGFCHEKLGTCVCAPGFQGRHCEEACGRNRVGPDCSEACDGGNCKRQLFCHHDPYGCSCAAGYRGDYCEYSCDQGEFGADCKQSCHCKGGFCDPYTGACTRGCAEGWVGASCHIPVGN